MKKTLAALALAGTLGVGIGAGQAMLGTGQALGSAAPAWADGSALDNTPLSPEETVIEITRRVGESTTIEVLGRVVPAVRSVTTMSSFSAASAPVADGRRRGGLPGDRPRRPTGRRGAGL